MLAQIDDHRRGGNQVKVEQMYSERIPCVTCTNFLNTVEPEAAIFFTVPERFHASMAGAARGQALMRAYGITP